MFERIQLMTAQVCEMRHALVCFHQQVVEATSKPPDVEVPVGWQRQPVYQGTRQQGNNPIIQPEGSDRQGALASLQTLLTKTSFPEASAVDSAIEHHRHLELGQHSPQRRMSSAIEHITS